MELNIEQRREAARIGDQARVGMYRCILIFYIQIENLIMPLFKKMT